MTTTPAHPPLFGRRRLLTAGVAGAASAAAAGVFAGWPGRADAAGRPSSAGASSALQAALSAFADDVLQRQPEQATALGLDVGARAPLKHRLSDLSADDAAAWKALVASMHRRLSAIDPATLSAADRLHRDTVLYAAERGAEGTAFRYGGGAAAGFTGGTSPYVVSQQNGAVTAVPEFLDAQHKIANADDADAYLDRVAAFARQIDQETERLQADAAIGVVPPSFIASNALGQLRAFRAVPGERQRLVLSLARRTEQQGIAGDWAGRAADLTDRLVLPALDRQIAALAAATAKSGDGGAERSGVDKAGVEKAGVDRLPDGAAYYRWALRLGTTTTQSAAEIHRTGLEQNTALQSRLDALLKSQGLTQGSVGARVQALNRDPRFLYPDTDAGRADLIAYLNDRLAAIRPLLPKISHLPLKAEVEVKRVPVDIQDGAALGYMNFAALDGSRPAIYYVNLKSTALWPRYQLPTLTVHEGVPGHTWQGAYLAEHHDEVPLITSLMGFNAFVEGWALYAEQLVDEQGLYADDPFGRIGYLQAQQFRACRLVVDTGLHSMHWSRDQAVRFLTEQTGKGTQAMTSEVDRYCASPGQACGYKVGHNEIVRLRAKAQAALGPKFDLAAFDDVVVQTGGVPLTLLASAVDASIARQLR